MRAIVIGATGTIGREIVKELAPRHEILRAGRTTADLPVDITSADSIHALFEAAGPIDAVVCAAGDARFDPMDALTDADYRLGLTSKLMGQVSLTRIASTKLRDNGSITLTSGMLARMPTVGTTSIAMVNSGIEGFVRSAALELPRGIRINAVSPQWTVETLALYGMDTRPGVPAERVALGYVESVEGSMTGTIVDAGWVHDPTQGSVSVAVP